MGFDEIKVNIWKTIEKAIKGALTAGVAWVCTWIAQHFGLDISLEHQAAVVIFFTGLLVGARNFIKTKFGSNKFVQFIF